MSEFYKNKVCFFPTQIYNITTRNTVQDIKFLTKNLDVTRIVTDFDCSEVSIS